MSPEIPKHVFLVRNYVILQMVACLTCTAFSLVVLIPSFLTKSTIPVLRLPSSLFSTTWADLFRTRFSSVVACLAQTRPGEFDSSRKLMLTSHKMSLCLSIWCNGIYPMDMAFVRSSGLQICCVTEHWGKAVFGVRSNGYYKADIWVGNLESIPTAQLLFILLT